MSASETNIERQKKRHIGPLIGMALAVLFGLGVIFSWLTHEAERAPGPQGAEQSAPANGVTQEVAPTAPESMGATGTPAAPGAAPEPAVPTAPVTPPTAAPSNN